MGHLARCLCARALVSEGRIKTHNSNGTYCAVMDQCVYITCASSKDKITDEGCGTFKVVHKYTNDMEPDGVATGFCPKCVHWVMLTKEAWDAFTGASALHPTHAPTHTAQHALNTLTYAPVV